MSDSNGRHLLGERDFVDVIDENDAVVGTAPKHWDESQLAPGTRLKKRATRSSSNGASTPSGQQTPPPPPTDPVEPAGNASTDDWKAYAIATGAKPEDLVVDGKDLTRDELKAKYGKPAAAGSDASGDSGQA